MSTATVPAEAGWWAVFKQENGDGWWCRVAAWIIRDGGVELAAICPGGGDYSGPTAPDKDTQFAFYPERTSEGHGWWPASAPGAVKVE